MLVLNRRPEEAIIIDGNIRVVVLSCDKRGVRLGIEAPASVPVLREELVREVAQENQRASDAGITSEWLAQLPLAPPSGPNDPPSR